MADKLFRLDNNQLMVDNLYSTNGIVNETVYSAGPTGGSLDIQDSSLAYLNTVKGYSVI